jgi:hypothetical protein
VLGDAAALVRATNLLLNAAGVAAGKHHPLREMKREAAALASVCDEDRAPPERKVDPFALRLYPHCVRRAWIGAGAGVRGGSGAPVRRRSALYGDTLRRRIFTLRLPLWRRMRLGPDGWTPLTALMCQSGGVEHYLSSPVLVDTG